MRSEHAVAITLIVRRLPYGKEHASSLVYKLATAYLLCVLV
jgi:hypothetical protein